MPKKIKTITLGCRFNFYESEVSKAIIKAIDPMDDVVVVNTCSVTHEAERQSKQLVRKAIRENRDSKIIVTGCAAKTSLDYFRNLDGVFKVIQNDEKGSISAYEDIPHSLDSGKNFCEEEIFEEDDELFKNRARCFLQIQNGCDHFCTYCIVPFTRGRSRSMPVEVILNRIKHFLELGFKEIVLSGIDITSYGRDMRDCNLSDIIKTVLNNFKDLNRLRISSIDPKGIDDKLLDILMKEERIMPHFHLSIQSGSDDVLKAMKRRHTRQDVIRICNSILDRRPDVVFGSDFIAGFPAETEASFQDTLKLIDEAHLSLMHVFPYSSRSGTVASHMIQLSRELILDRAQRLRKKSQAAKIGLFKSMVGKRISGGIIETCKDGVSFGKTDSFVPFIVQSEITPNTIVSGMLVAGYSDDCLKLS